VVGAGLGVDDKVQETLHPQAKVWFSLLWHRMNLSVKRTHPHYR